MSKQALFWFVCVVSFGASWFFATHVGPAQLNSFMEVWYGFFSLCFAVISIVMGAIAITEYD